MFSTEEEYARRFNLSGKLPPLLPDAAGGRARCLFHTWMSISCSRKKKKNMLRERYRKKRHGKANNVCPKTQSHHLLPVWEGRAGWRKVGEGPSRESWLSDSQPGNKPATPFPTPQSPSKNQSLCSSSPAHRNRGDIASVRKSPLEKYVTFEDIRTRRWILKL